MPTTVCSKATNNRRAACQLSILCSAAAALGCCLQTLSADAAGDWCYMTEPLVKLLEGCYTSCASAMQRSPLHLHMQLALLVKKRKFEGYVSGSVPAHDSFICT
jgi:hypothetical protein